MAQNFEQVIVPVTALSLFSIIFKLYVNFERKGLNEILYTAIMRIFIGKT